MRSTASRTCSSPDLSYHSDPHIFKVQSSANVVKKRPKTSAQKSKPQFNPSSSAENSTKTLIKVREVKPAVYRVQCNLCDHRHDMLVTLAATFMNALMDKVRNRRQFVKII